MVIRLKARDSHEGGSEAIDNLSQVIENSLLIYSKPTRHAAFGVCLRGDAEPELFLHPNEGTTHAFRLPRTARSYATGLHFSGLVGTSRLMLKRGSASVGRQRPVSGSG
jgi:hypothetical protein